MTMTDEERAEWGKRVLNLRAEAGISTQSAAAFLAGMYVSQYAGLESGRRIPTLPSLARIVAGFGLDPAKAGEILFGPEAAARTDAEANEPEE